MTEHPHKAIAITDRSSIGEARRESLLISERAGMKEHERGRSSLIVTELATNLFLHAAGGEIIIRMLPAEMGPGLEMIALDRGPGIADLQRCMADGYSGGGTRGCGLGAVQRLSTEFDIYSAQPGGTVVVSRVQRMDGKPQAPAQFSAISIPAPGESECGDGWNLQLNGNTMSVIVADGLGHGPLAACAATTALAVFETGQFDTPVGYFETAHAPMSTTRGAAIAVAQIDLNRGRLHYAGVGNIAGRIASPGADSQSLLSHNGIVGTPVRKLHQFDYQWQRGDLLIMHSDGLSDRWKLNDYPGLARADTAVIAAVLYRDARRGRDDATVLVARLQSI
ncbi:MAG: SpoIIE family protein phosphatase [Candidatus Binataceae bacterium]|jgi:anti-sigma regulatory factor (Ser/Thr protein kinase)